MSSRKSIFIFTLTTVVVCVLAVASACGKETPNANLFTKDTKQIITVGVDSTTDNYCEVRMMNRNEDGT